MSIYNLATQVLEQIIERTNANIAAHGHWWDPGPIALIPFTKKDAENRLASLERRLKKAKEAFESSLSPEELEWQRFIPKNINQTHTRKAFTAKLYDALSHDEKKLELYRQYQKLEEEHGHAASVIKYNQYEETASPEERSAENNFHLAINWPKEVETQQQAESVLLLIGRALELAGYGYEGYSITTPVVYFKKGKLVLEIDDEAEQFRFDTQSLDAIDWKKLRDTLARLKPAIESAVGWKKRPTANGVVWEKISPLVDPQMEILETHTMVSDDDTSHWNNWRPPVPGKKTIYPVEVEYCDKNGEDNLAKLPRLLAPEDTSYLEPSSFDKAKEKEGIVSYELDTSGSFKKATVTAEAAPRYLHDLLGIEGLDLSPPPSPERGKAA